MPEPNTPTVLERGGHKFDRYETVIGGHTLESYNQWFITGTLPLWQRHGLADKLFSSYCEIGVNCGLSFAYVLENMMVPGTPAIGIDSYRHPKARVQAGLDLAAELVVTNLAPWADRYQLLTEPSGLVLARWFHIMADSQHRGAKLQSHDFDFVYVDGAHAANEALLDMMLVWPHIQDGGIMVVDDFNRQFSIGVKQVRPAVMAFFDCFSHQLEPLFICQEQAAFVKRVGRRRRR